MAFRFQKSDSINTIKFQRICGWGGNFEEQKCSFLKALLATLRI